MQAPMNSLRNSVHVKWNPAGSVIPVMLTLKEAPEGCKKLSQKLFT